MKTLSYLLVAIAVLLSATPAWAGPKSKAAQELAEFMFKKGSKEVTEHGVEAFARKVEGAALKHGDEVFGAVKSVGPKALPMIETHGASAAKILGRHGEHGATWVVSRPSAMSLVAKHGDDAALALVKHPGAIAEPLVEKAGSSAIKAFTAVGPQGGRRLAMLAEEAPKLATDPKLLDVIARFGDAGMAFVWKHKGTLAVSAALVAFLADPEPFINGTKDLATSVVENVAKPIAEVPGKAIEGAAQHAMPEVSRSTNWTLVFLAVLVLGALAWVAARRSKCPI